MKLLFSINIRRVWICYPLCGPKSLNCDRLWLICICYFLLSSVSTCSRLPGSIERGPSLSSHSPLFNPLPIFPLIAPWAQMHLSFSLSQISNFFRHYMTRTQLIFAPQSNQSGCPKGCCFQVDPQLCPRSGFVNFLLLVFADILQSIERISVSKSTAVKFLFLVFFIPVFHPRSFDSQSNHLTHFGGRFTQFGSSPQPPSRNPPIHQVPLPYFSGFQGFFIYFCLASIFFWPLVIFNQIAWLKFWTNLSDHDGHRSDCRYFMMLDFLLLRLRM